MPRTAVDAAYQTALRAALVTEIERVSRLAMRRTTNFSMAARCLASTMRQTQRRQPARGHPPATTTDGPKSRQPPIVVCSAGRKLIQEWRVPEINAHG